MTKTELSRAAALPRLALAAACAAALLGTSNGFAQTGTTASGQKPTQTAPGPTASRPQDAKTQPTASQPGSQPAGGAKPTSGQPARPPATGTAPTVGPSAQARPQQPPTPPADYVIGPDDVLQVVYWREKDLNAEVVVRPDGKISLPLVNDIQAAGLTPDELRERVQQAANRYVTDPSVTIAVKQINSRRVFVTGNVNKPGPYPLNDSITVLQMLAMAGGLSEFANDKEILIMRNERGQAQSFKFNYRDVRKGKGLQQNILLKPGDTIVVP